MIYFRLPYVCLNDYATRQSYAAAFIGVLIFFALFLGREPKVWLTLLTNDTDLVSAIAWLFFLLAPLATYLVVLLPSILGGKTIRFYYKKSGSHSFTTGLLLGIVIGALIGAICSLIGTIFYNGSIFNLLLNAIFAGGVAGLWYSRKLKIYFLQGNS
jgi:hypothetical protein